MKKTQSNARNLEDVAQQAANDLQALIDEQGAILKDMERQLSRFEAVAYDDADDPKLDSDVFESICWFMKLHAERKRALSDFRIGRNLLRSYSDPSPKGKSGEPK